MTDLNGKTQLYGIIGDPVEHSLSPLFQNHFLQQANHNAAYLPFHVKPTGLEHALSGLHAAHIQGVNVTVPHKELALSFVEADKHALRIGAVNTLKRSKNLWLATNTDWQGFAEVLQGLNADVSEAPVILFGAGGTSRAVCHALHHQGVKQLWICNRSPERAKRLIADLKQLYPNILLKQLDWDENTISTHISFSQIVINTSSVGLNDQDIFPFTLDGHGIAIDAVYKPGGATAFTKAATIGGFSAVDGLPMLIAQGIASFKYWHSENLSSASFTLPENLQSLRWVEKKLARQPLQLPGWGT